MGVLLQMFFSSSMWGFGVPHISQGLPPRPSSSRAEVWTHPCRCHWTFIRFGHRRCVNTRRPWGRRLPTPRWTWRNDRRWSKCPNFGRVEGVSRWGGSKKPTIVVFFFCGKMSRKWLAWLDFFISLNKNVGMSQNSTKWWARTIVVNMEWYKPPKKIAKTKWVFLALFHPLKKVEFWAPTSRSWFFGRPTLGRILKPKGSPGRRSRLLKERFLRFWLQKPRFRKMERDDSKHHLLYLLTSSCGVNIYRYMGFYWDFDMVKLVASRVEKYWKSHGSEEVSRANLLLVFWSEVLKPTILTGCLKKALVLVAQPFLIVMVLVATRHSPRRQESFGIFGEFYVSPQRYATMTGRGKDNTMYGQDGRYIDDTWRINNSRSGWWFQIFFIFNPNLGEIIQFDILFFKWVGSTTN